MRPSSLRVRPAALLVVGFLSSATASLRAADPIDALLNLNITEVRVDLEGRPIQDASITELIETRIGKPLHAADVRETMTHLFGLGRFQDVRVHAEASQGGVAVRYELIPLHSVQRIEFRGSLGLSEGQLRSVVVERFGSAPSVGRAAEAARSLVAYYRERGFITAQVTPRAIVEHAPDRITLVFEIESGLQTRIRTITIEGDSPLPREGLLSRLKVEAGAPYERATIQTNLGRYADELRSKGFYEARVDHTPTFDQTQNSVDLIVTVDRGSHISIAFEGDSLPSQVRSDLVPVEREGSVDEDLLEDANRRIAGYLQRLGYRDAEVTNVRTGDDREQVITFRVQRGALYRLESLEIAGELALSEREVQSFLKVERGSPFVKSDFDAGLANAEQEYRRRGYVAAKLTAEFSLQTGGSATDQVVAVTARVQVVEGPRALVRSLAFRGNEALTEAQLRTGLLLEAGRPFYQPQLGSDLDAVVLKYLNRGYQTATATSDVKFGDDRTGVDIVVTMHEGPQVFVDHVLIVGNNRTNNQTIQRELALKPGQPLGLADIVESQRRLSALGLFRRARITELRHATSETQRDILVTVEEAPLTTIGYGGGVEGGRQLRRVEGEQGAVEVFQVAPRGFFEIGRRNLWGKNRSVNFFARVSFRALNPESDLPIATAATDSGYGFNEYRVLFTYREPRIFGTGVDALANAFVEQGIRSSFNFNRKGVRTDFGRRLTSTISVQARYLFDTTALFDERIRPADKPLIDRLFPQVRISAVAGSVVRDTRDDKLDPAHGTLIGFDTELAARAMGSEVGFVKTFLQSYFYRRLPGKSRVVFAGGARVGLASGFPQEVVRTDEQGNPIIGPDGQPVVSIVEDLPASERFFAGGDTTVRGFALDRLGTPETFDQDGFPKGGHGLLIFNGELRFPIWRDLGGVGFVDGGNVFEFVDDIDLGRIRGAVGFGIRYRSPIGPLRVDLGFKLDQQQFANGQPERRTALHISFGQAF